jgi:carbon-monoxide dehydrogenase medium subunit
MSRLLKPFEYFEPKTVEEAVQTLSRYGDKAKVLAGGTDLLISMKKRKITPKYVVYIKGISELDYIQFRQEAGLKIGALATHSTIADSPIIKDKFELLATACGKVGTPQVRNMGTIGGNICQGGPSQDTIPSLLVLDAKLKLVNSNGERIVPIDQFFIAPFKTACKEAELLTEIQIPTPPPRSAGCYKWFTKIVTVDETLVGVAVLMSCDSTDDICSDIKIASCSVAPTPMRARRAEEVLRGKKIDNKLIDQAAQVAAGETKPRSRADYRRRMTRLLVRDTITETWQKITHQEKVS